jgi:hypothetical protein
VLNLPLVEAKTVATTALILIGLYFVLVLEASGHRRGPAVSALVLALAAGYALVLLWPWSREFFALAAPTPAILRHRCRRVGVRADRALARRPTLCAGRAHEPK